MSNDDGGNDITDIATIVYLSISMQYQAAGISEDENKANLPWDDFIKGYILGYFFHYASNGKVQFSGSERIEIMQSIIINLYGQKKGSEILIDYFENNTGDTVSDDFERGSFKGQQDADVYITGVRNEEHIPPVGLTNHIKLITPS